MSSFVFSSIIIVRDAILERHFYSRFLGLDSSLLRLKFLSVFLPSSFISARCCPRIDSSFPVSWIFLWGILKPEKSLLSEKSASRKTMNSMEQKTLAFCQINVQEFLLWLGVFKLMEAEWAMELFVWRHFLAWGDPPPLCTVCSSGRRSADQKPNSWTYNFIEDYGPNLEN